MLLHLNQKYNRASCISLKLLWIWIWHHHGRHVGVICKSQNGESGNGMRGMMGTRGIRMGMRGIGVGMRGIRVILCENLCVYCFGENPGVRGEFFTIQLLWASARLLVTRILPCLPSGWVLLQGNEGVGSVQDFIFLCLCLVWIGRIRMQEEFKIPLCNPMVETLFSDRYTFRIPSNINDGILLRKQPTALTHRLFRQKKLHHRPPTGSHMRIWLEALWMWGLGRLQGHGIHYNNVLDNINNNNTVSATQHIHKKNLFLLPIPTEVAFNATILYPTLRDSVFQQSICRCDILLNHRTTAFSRLSRTTLW